MNDSSRFPIAIPLAAFLFAAAHLAYEHFTTGVLAHHIFGDPEMPTVSNWFGLITLPLLGVLLARRVRAHPSTKRWAGIPVGLLAALTGALGYGVVMAASYELGAESVTTALFAGMFVCGLVFPVYRAEYLLGYVAGMTITFGGVLPLMVASVVASVSFVLRYLASKVAGAIRRSRT